LRRVQLRRVQLRRVQLRRVQLRRVQLRRVQLRRVQLRRVQLRRVQLRDFQESDQSLAKKHSVGPLIDLSRATASASFTSNWIFANRNVSLSYSATVVTEIHHS
ncbi:MAG: pentapeptide repeat-containing protein, partial [Planctomycetaceae bacterium]|nr:pentapeptide repeat-containing protein [Planctomycetaceae bacterium]